MKRKRRQPEPKADVSGSLPEKKAHRKPVFTLDPEQVILKCKSEQRDLICAGLVLAVQKLMLRFGWPITVLAAESHVSASHLSEFLRLEKFLSHHLAKRVARAFGLKLAVLDKMAEDLVDD
jgi:plasmid maintenance system antidote protein VapI